MTRREQTLAFLLKTFPAGSPLALKPDSLELDIADSYKATLFWRDGVAQLVRIPGDVTLSNPLSIPYAWVAVMKQDGAGSPDLRLNDPDFASRRNIAKQAAQLPFGRALYVRYFTLVNC